VRRVEGLPDAVWDALVEYHNPADTQRLAESAERRGHALHAIALFRQAARAGDTFAGWRFARLLAAQGRVGEAIAFMQEPAKQDGGYADRLLDLLADHSCLDDLERLADAGHAKAARQLVKLLAEHRQIDWLRRRADTGDTDAVWRLVELLIEQGDFDEALGRLNRHDIGSPDMFQQLAEHGRLDEVIGILRRRAELGDRPAAMTLVDLLARHDRIQDLRERADAGDGLATAHLVDLLGERGQMDELEHRANAGDGRAGLWLAWQLQRQHRLREAEAVVRQLVDAGVDGAALQLAGLLSEQNRLAEAIHVLRQRSDFGDEHAAVHLADLLDSQGEVEEALDVLRQHTDAHVYGEFTIRRLVDDIRVQYNSVEELRQHAAEADDDAGEGDAGRRLVVLLAKHGRIDELRWRADAGDLQASWRLVVKLAEQQDIVQLRRRADSGEEIAARWLADLLSEQERAEELAAWADSGNTHAAMALAALLVKRDEVPAASAVLRRRADAGDLRAARRLIDLLSEHELLDELKQETNAGTPGAAERLSDIRKVSASDRSGQ
jgi:hypothetical protein